MPRKPSKPAKDASEEVEILRAIWNEMKALNGRIDTLRVETQSGFADLGGKIEVLGKRIDNILLGEHGRD